MNSQGLDRRLDPPSIVISHGPWSATLVDDEFVDVTWRGTRLLAGLRVVVRDPDWQTVANRVTETAITEDSGLLRVTIRTEAMGHDIDYSSTLTAAITTDQMELRFDGRANAPLRCNRIGLVILHPPEAKRAPVVVEHPNGKTTTALFPARISPHQPFLDIAAMSWDLGDVRARIEFSGDVFETEDQRNWTDASFKTYSRPLDLPFPYSMEEGELTEQRVVLRAGGTHNGGHRAPMAVAERFLIGPPSGATMPSIGTAARVGGPSRSIESGVRLPALLAEIDGADPTWCDALDAAVADARQLGAELDLRLILGGPDEGSAVLERLEDVPLVRLGVFDRGSHMTEIDLWQWLSKQPFVRSREIDLVVGTRAHFTELNRSHERIESVLADADGAAFSITPQMHATEVRHIVSSVRAQGEVVRSAAAFLGSSPIHIGPITLESRFNAVATKAAGAAVQTMPDELTVTPFAAAWLVGSLAAIVPANVASLAYFRVGELSGTEAGLLLPELAKLAGLPVLAVGRGADSSMAAFAVAAADGPCVYFSNLSRSPRHIVIENADGDDHPVLIPPWSYRSVELAGVVGR